MTTRYTWYSAEHAGPIVTPEERATLGPDGALALLRRRLRQRARNLLDPQWQHGRSFPSSTLQVSAPGTVAYVAQYEYDNAHRCLTRPGWRYLPPSAPLPDVPDWAMGTLVEGD